MDSDAVTELGDIIPGKFYVYEDSTDVDAVKKILDDLTDLRSELDALKEKHAELCEARDDAEEMIREASYTKQKLSEAVSLIQRLVGWHRVARNPADEATRKAFELFQPLMKEAESYL